MKFSIRTKLVVLILFILCLAVGLISYQNLTFFHKDKETYVYDLISQVIDVQGKELDKRLQSLRQLMEIYAEFAKYRLSVTERERFLKKYRDFYFIGTLRLGKNVLRDDLVIVERTRLKSVGWTPNEIKSNPRILKMARETRQFNALNVTVKDSSPLVALFVRTSPTRLVLGLLPQSRILDVSETKRVYDAYVTDTNGNIIMHADGMKLLTRENLGNRPMVTAWMKNPTLPLTREYTIDASNILAAYTSIQNESLGMFVEVSKEQAFVAAKRLIKSSSIWTAAVFLFSVLFGLLFAYTLTRPLKVLANLTRRVAKGDFSAQAEVKANDEIGELIGSFNRMSQELDIRDKKLEETHQQLVQSEKMSAFGQMSAGIAHEVKNPLAGILGYAQLSKRKMADDSPAVKYLDIIEKETRRCKDIIENLMKFARQEESVFERFPINQAVRDAIALVDHQITLSGIKIVQELAADEEMPEIIGSANQLQQVLMNLMINAQHAIEGKGAVTVRTTNSGQQQAIIEVADTGKGIKPEHVKKIFEPFFTTKPAGKGTGLGLAVSYGIIKDHKGDIEVTSKVGQGTTFKIFLPVADSSEAPKVTK